MDLSGIIRPRCGVISKPLIFAFISVRPLDTFSWQAGAGAAAESGFSWQAGAGSTQQALLTADCGASHCMEDLPLQTCMRISMQPAYLLANMSSP